MYNKPLLKVGYFDATYSFGGPNSIVWKQEIIVQNPFVEMA
jgi:hypothetical protein